MQPSFSNDGSYSMIPFIENPILYKHHFSHSYKPDVGDVTLLCGGKVPNNIVSNGLNDLQTQNKEEIDSGEMIAQVGGGDVQLVSPSEGVLERAKAEMQREHEKKKMLKAFHSMSGRGKAKVKSNKGKTSVKKNKTVKSKGTNNKNKKNKKSNKTKKSKKTNKKKTKTVKKVNKKK